MAKADEQRQLEEIERELRGLTETAVVKIASELEAVTPKHTGYTAANWISSVGRPQDAPVGTIGRAGVVTAKAAAEAGRVRVAGYRIEQGSAFVSNAHGNAERLNDGHSLQEPAGFVQRAIANAVKQVI